MDGKPPQQIFYEGILKDMGDYVEDEEYDYCRKCNKKFPYESKKICCGRKVSSWDKYNVFLGKLIFPEEDSQENQTQTVKGDD